ncbi:MAG: hypothetical protein ACKVVP_20275 [Chloroflexota bacterium]
MAVRERDMSPVKRATLEVIIAHSSPGRLRLRVSRPAIESGTAVDAARAFDEQAGVVNARVNEAARCIVVHYDERAATLDSLLGLVRQGGVDIKVTSADVPRELMPSRTPLTMWLSRKASNVDERLFTASRGSADLRTLVPVSLAALAVREILAGRTPAVPWYALAWYAFDTFGKLRKPDAGSDRDSR